jgi:hypothetical protein
MEVRQIPRHSGERDSVETQIVIPIGGRNLQFSDARPPPRNCRSLGRLGFFAILNFGARSLGMTNDFWHSLERWDPVTLPGPRTNLGSGVRRNDERIRRPICEFDHLGRLAERRAQGGGGGTIRPDESGAALSDSGCVQAELGEQVAPFAVSHESIG